MDTIGRIIRLHRTWKGFSSSELAERAGISSSYLSKVEGDKVNPSIALLSDIADALEMDLETLFKHESNDLPKEQREQPKKQNLNPIVIRSDARKTLKPAGSSSIYELLTPDLQRNLQLIIVRHVPGEKGQVFSHVGEESMYCVEGQLQVNVGTEVFILNSGDCISFDSLIHHSVTAVGDHIAVLISAQTPPSF